MIPTELAETLESNPEILGGTICFKGTRVPVESLLDYMADGISLDRFLRGFPTVDRKQALAESICEVASHPGLKPGAAR